MSKIKYYSQFGQDRFLDTHVFKGMKGGFFLDVGASDGITYSNTYFFERNNEWDGICIEPHPVAFEKLIQNRISKSYNIGVSNHDGEFEFSKIDGYAEMLSGLSTKYDERHLARIKEELMIHGGRIEAIVIPCKRLETIISDAKIEKIDYCSIDIEGGELDVIKSINFEEVDIEIFSIENNYKSKEIQYYLAQFGYRIIKRIECDEIYQKKRKWWRII